MYKENKDGVMEYGYEDCKVDYTPKVLLGNKVFFKGEKRGYDVKAVSPEGRYAICTKPFNLKKTVQYCIIDFKEGIRSPNDYIFNPYDYTKKSEINKCMKDLLKGEAKLSQRHKATLWITTVITK